MSQKIIDLINELTLEEKASLCSGLNNWQTKSIERLGIPSIYMTDGPHGLRKDRGDGFGNSYPSTCFPTASALGATWNIELMKEVGEAIGKECQANDVQIILGPGTNMKRSPLGGRNFEYFAEDPVLSGEISAAMIQGIQNQGIGTSLKHYTANNQELERMTGDSVVDERTLREIYLPAFEIAIKKAQPWTIMCAYNRINGIFGSEHRYLLHDVLKKEFGFEGFVVSDWGASDNRVAGVHAGMHLEMPGNGGLNDKKIVAAVQNGELAESRLDEVVSDLLHIIFNVYENRQPGRTYNAKAHRHLAKKVAGEGIVLLKNEDHILPIDTDKIKRIAVIGQFAKKPRFQGSGSSQVNPTEIDTALDYLQKIVGTDVEITYTDGYPTTDEINETIMNQAQRNAAQADVAIVFAGLPDSYESEGFDRKHIDLPANHNTLIDVVSQVQKNLVVVLTNGSAVAMPWIDKAKGIVEGLLAGQAGGSAIADVLMGNINPSGKLTETYPKQLEDTPTYLSFPGESLKAIYGEGIFTGYRYFEKKKIEPLFPFGFGLSYTNFEYLNLLVNKTEIKDNEPLEVRVTVKNSGNRFGKETVQVYVRDIESRLIRPLKELKGFQKIGLQPQEVQTLTFTLNRRDFAFFDPLLNDWVVESGEFEILVGTSSVHILLSETIKVEATETPVPKLHRLSLVKEFKHHPRGLAFYEKTKKEMMPIFLKTALEVGGEELKQAEAFFTAILEDMPVSKLVTFSGGDFSEEALEGMLKEMNS